MHAVSRTLTCGGRSAQVNDAAEVIYDLVDAQANLIFGAVVDPAMKNGEVRRTVHAESCSNCHSSPEQNIDTDCPCCDHSSSSVPLAPLSPRGDPNRCWAQQLCLGKRLANMQSVTCDRVLCAQVNVTLIATGFGDGVDVAGLGPQPQVKQYPAAQPVARQSEPDFAAAGAGRSNGGGGGVEIPAFLRKRRERGR